jgi:hypothetical protein
LSNYERQFNLEQLCKASDGGKTEKIKTIEELAKLSGSLMKTTARVGAPDEDASMAKARPRLAKINTRFITTDSQMGLKQEYDSVVEKHRCGCGNGLT